MLMLLVTTQVMGTVRDHRHYAKKGQSPPSGLSHRGSMSSSTNYYVPRNNKNKKKPKTTMKPPPAVSSSKQQVYNKPPPPNKKQQSSASKPNRTLDLFRGAVSKLLSIGRVKLDFHNVAYSPMVAPVISIKKI
jgi:hypothetical protein